MKDSRRLWLTTLVALLLTACRTPAAPPPPAAPLLMHAGAEQRPAPLFLQAHDDLLLRAQPADNAAVTGALRTGAVAQVKTSDTDKEWYQVACAQDADCWLRPVASRVSLFDAEQGARWSDTPAPTEEPQRVDLAARQTLFISDTVTLTNMDHYLMQALAGEELTVHLAAADGAVYVAVVGVADAQVYQPLQARTSRWSAQLTTSQDYLISVATDEIGAAYTLRVSRAGRAASEELPPHRLGLSATLRAGRLQGVVQPGQAQRYIVRAPAEALLSVRIASPQAQATFAVIGLQNGKTYKWFYDKTAAWSTLLPEAQDLLIVVGTDGEELPFTMNVSLH